MGYSREAQASQGKGLGRNLRLKVSPSPEGTGAASEEVQCKGSAFSLPTERKERISHNIPKYTCLFLISSQPYTKSRQATSPAHTCYRGRTGADCCTWWLPVQ